MIDMIRIDPNVKVVEKVSNVQQCVVDGTTKYQMHILKSGSVELDSYDNKPWNMYAKDCLLFSQKEKEFILTLQSEPKIKWAVENSLNGLYIHRYEEPASNRLTFQFRVYLTEKQITFWKLKFDGNS